MVEKITFFPFDIDYQKGIRLFGRTEDGKSICVIDKSFQTYFYILPEKEINLEKYIDRIKKTTIIKEGIICKVTGVEILKLNHLNKINDTIKVTINNPDLLADIAEKIRSYPETKSRKEIDIPLYKKYLISKNIIPLTLCEVTGNIIANRNYKTNLVVEGEVRNLSPDIYEKPKILSIDIEVYGDIGGKEKAENDPILMIAFKGSDGFEKVLTWKRFKDYQKYVEFVENELELIGKARDIIENYRPDYIVGYNSDNFDIPYIEKRAQKYKIKLNLGLDGSELNLARGRASGAKIKGIIHIDIYNFVRKILSGTLKLDTYTLDAVANKLIGEKKKDVDIGLLSKKWDKNLSLKEFCEYNLHDADITLKLFESILPSLIELTKIIGMPIYDISRMSYGQMAENYFIKKSKEFNQLCPNKPTNDIIAIRRMSSYQGAFVMQPKPGLYKDIVVLDFASLYASIIVAKNIGLSSINSKKGNKTPDILDESGKKVHYYFDSKNKAFIPKLVEEIIEKRRKIKDILKQQGKNPILEARSYALKTVGNSMYGYFGFFGARWYSKECAASITAFAREYILNVIKEAKKHKFIPIYSDTDSIAMTYSGKTEKMVLDFMNKINKKLKGTIELELENFYPHGIFVSKKSESQGAKKKYALINKKGEIKVVGFETIRRDWSIIARRTQMKVFEIILKENDIEKAVKYVQKIINDLQNKKIKREDLIVKTQLQKNLKDYQQIGPHVMIGRELEKKGFKVNAGTTVTYIITKGKGPIRDRVKLPEDYKEKEYDIDYYINNQVVQAIEKVFEAVGYKKEDLIKDIQQSKLGDF